jgi:hypothetical protein
MTRDELAEGLEALAYWRARRRSLSRLRLAARRECDRMADAWERRLRAALVHGDVPPDGLALRAGALVVRARVALLARRWRRRALTAAAAAGAVLAAGVLLLDALARALV